MRLQCSYCRSFFGEAEPLDDDAISHGMCDECFDHFDAQWEGQDLEGFLDKFRFPVLAVGSDSRVVAVNEHASAFVQRPRSASRIGACGAVPGRSSSQPLSPWEPTWSLWSEMGPDRP